MSNEMSVLTSLSVSGQSLGNLVMILGITFRLELQEVYELLECNFSSLKGSLLRLERPIPHSSREGLALATNLPFPYAVTAVSNDDMKLFAQTYHNQQYVPCPPERYPSH